MTDYPQTITWEVINTENFVQVIDVTAWSPLYNFAAGIFRAQMRASVDSPIAAYEWNSTNGRMMYSSANGLDILTLIAPLSETKDFLGTYVFDLRFELAGTAFAVLAGGTITWDQGVTRENSDGQVDVNEIPVTASVAITPSLLNMLIFG